MVDQPPDVDMKSKTLFRQ